MSHEKSESRHAFRGFLAAGRASRAGPAGNVYLDSLWNDRTIGCGRNAQNSPNALDTPNAQNGLNALGTLNAQKSPNTLGAPNAQNSYNHKKNTRPGSPRVLGGLPGQTQPGHTAGLLQLRT